MGLVLQALQMLAQRALVLLEQRGELGKADRGVELEERPDSRQLPKRGAAAAQSPMERRAMLHESSVNEDHSATAHHLLLVDGAQEELEL
eukprot:1484901-Prymnesium_polylepis.1